MPEMSATARKQEGAAALLSAILAGVAAAGSGTGPAVAVAPRMGTAAAYIGVTKRSEDAYEAHCTVNAVDKYLGEYGTAIEAAQAHDCEASKTPGLPLNFSSSGGTENAVAPLREANTVSARATFPGCAGGNTGGMDVAADAVSSSEHGAVAFSVSEFLDSNADKLRVDPKRVKVSAGTG